MDRDPGLCRPLCPGGVFLTRHRNDRLTVKGFHLVYDRVRTFGLGRVALSEKASGQVPTLWLDYTHKRPFLRSI